MKGWMDGWMDGLMLWYKQLELERERERGIDRFGGDNTPLLYIMGRIRYLCVDILLRKVPTLCIMSSSCYPYSVLSLKFGGDDACGPC
jgi:hypothetical protein